MSEAGQKRGWTTAEMRSFLDSMDEEESQLIARVRTVKKALQARRLPPGRTVQEWAQERAPLQAELDAAKRALTEFTDTYNERIIAFQVARAPRPTREQARRLVLLLAPESGQ